MSDEMQNNQGGAIPPKAVPPQVQPVAEGNADSPTVRRQTGAPNVGAPSPAPRTVRLKPIGAPAGGGVPGGTPITSSASAEAAADVLKRMTARIAMMSGEEISGKKRTGPILPGAAKKATSPISATGGSDADSPIRKVTSRIQVPSVTGPISELPPDTPKTIKIRHLSGTQPILVTQQIPLATQPIPSMDQIAAAQSGSRQAPGKAKTSQLAPEQQAAAAAQSAGAPAAETTSGGTPKTIKLKRPGEMSTIKVAVTGAGASSAAPHAAGEQQSDASAPLTQKKTIRVKRPMMPAASSGAEGGGGEGDSHMVAISPVAYAKAAPERGTGWFIALAVACILLAIGLVGLFSIQRYGWPMRTPLDETFQNG